MLQQCMNLWRIEQINSSPNQLYQLQSSNIPASSSFQQVLAAMRLESQSGALDVPGQGVYRPNTPRAREQQPNIPLKQSRLVAQPQIHVRVNAP